VSPTRSRRPPAPPPGPSTPSPLHLQEIPRPWLSGQPCDVSGNTTSEPATVPSFVGITVDGLTVTSDSSEVAAVQESSAR
jgi:hypothetical protein